MRVDGVTRMLERCDTSKFKLPGKVVMGVSPAPYTNTYELRMSVHVGGEVVWIMSTIQVSDWMIAQDSLWFLQAHVDMCCLRLSSAIWDKLVVTVTINRPLQGDVGVSQSTGDELRAWKEKS